MFGSGGMVFFFSFNHCFVYFGLDLYSRFLRMIYRISNVKALANVEHLVIRHTIMRCWDSELFGQHILCQSKQFLVQPTSKAIG
jgi:hypothetical protein